MDLLVLPEHSLHGEPLLADVALERPLSGVRPGVLPQPGRSGEASAADLAHKLQRPLVELLVLPQLLAGGEIFVAQEAAVRRLLLTGDTMCGHGDLMTKGAETRSSRERLLEGTQRYNNYWHYNIRVKKPHSPTGWPAHEDHQ